MSKKNTPKVDTSSSFDEHIESVEYSEIMQKSYIDYSMSVITERALPDVRDGLKPVQRRILYDMQELGATSNKPYRKCARIVGDTMGKFHPHGDSSIEGALVVMAQDFKQGRKLVDGHGNFGSIEGDGAAASRYIEARLESFTEDIFLNEIKYDTVDFRPNYDETQKEPTVLPAKLPNILINGTEGIAVGMASNIPPHNISEVCDATICYLKNPKITTEELMKYLPAPDFPTGGIISNKSELVEAYKQGAGKIKVRGRIKVEDGTRGKKKIVITEIPYTMIGDGISRFLNSVATLVENKTLSDITDISNHSSKGEIRIVLDVKGGADIEHIKNVLYKKTPLEETFGLNVLAIWNGRPHTMPLLDIMKSYSDFQYDIYKRKFQYLLKVAENQKEIDEGLIKAINCIDTIIAVLRGSKNTKQAKECIMSGKTDGITFKTKKLKDSASKLHFTDRQAQSILDMKLQRLIGLELDTLQKEYDKLIKDIERYKKILKSKTELKKEIIKEIERLKKLYGTKRKTELIDAEEIVLKEPEKKAESCYVLVDEKGYIHAIDDGTFERNKESIYNDFRFVIKTDTLSKIIIFTDIGNVHSIKISEIPSGKYKDKGIPIDNISNYKVIVENILCISSIQDKGEYLFVSRKGISKRVDAKEFDTNRKTVAFAGKLNEDRFIIAQKIKPTDSIIIKSTENRYGRMKASNVPVYSRNAKGCAITALYKNEDLESIIISPKGNKTVIVDTEKISTDKISSVARGTGRLKPLTKKG